MLNANNVWVYGLVYLLSCQDQVEYHQSGFLIKQVKYNTTSNYTLFTNFVYMIQNNETWIIDIWYLNEHGQDKLEINNNK
jgi:hypothetical protein